MYIKLLISAIGVILDLLVKKICTTIIVETYFYCKRKL